MNKAKTFALRYGALFGIAGATAASVAGALAAISPSSAVVLTVLSTILAGVGQGLKVVEQTTKED
jgi:hypothetical protein